MLLITFCESQVQDEGASIFTAVNLDSEEDITSLQMVVSACAAYIVRLDADQYFMTMSQS